MPMSAGEHQPITLQHLAEPLSVSITHHASVLPVRVLELSEELVQRRRQEEKEAQDMEKEDK